MCYLRSLRSLYDHALSLGENWELGTDQSVVCRGTTLLSSEALLPENKDSINKMLPW